MIASLSAFASTHGVWLYRREPVKDCIATFSCNYRDGSTQKPGKGACAFMFEAKAKQCGSWRITRAVLEHSHSSALARPLNLSDAPGEAASGVTDAASIATVSPSAPKPLSLPTPAPQHTSLAARLAFHQSVQAAPPEPVEPDRLAAFLLALQPASPRSTINAAVDQLSQTAITGTADLARFLLLDPTCRQRLLDSLPRDKFDLRDFLGQSGGG